MTTQANRESTAARWLIEQDDPEFSDEQRDALARWLVGSVENCRAYLRLVRAWRRTALLRRNETPVVYGVRRPAGAGKPGVSAKAGAVRRNREPLAPQLTRHFGQVLRETRLERRLSQAELSARSRVDRSYIVHLESGARSPTITVLWRLAGALEVPPSRLIEKLERRLARASTPASES